MSQFLSKKETHKKILEAINNTAEIVGSTLGPRGQNVGVAKANKGFIWDRKIIHDGVTVAQAIEPEDPYENFASHILTEAARKTVDKAGDGTTVTTIIAQSIFNECVRIIEAGENPMKLRKGLEDGLKKLLDYIKKYAIKINKFHEIRQVATISAEDEELGALVANTLWKVGVDGVISVEESKASETIVEHLEGMQIDKGYRDKFFVTDIERQTSTLENTYLLLLDFDFNSMDEMLPLLNELHSRQSSLVIIAQGFGGMVLPLLAQNKAKGTLLSLPILAPSMGDNQKNILEDIAIMTGARVISKDKGDKLKDVTLKDLGFCTYVTSTSKDTIIVSNKGNKELVTKRVGYIRSLIENNDFTSEWEREKARERLGHLTNGVSVIKVGGYTEIEMKERKERVIDAVHATRAAMETGIVAGGEIIYLNIRKILGDSLSEKILYNALEKPFYKLLENAYLRPDKYINSITKTKGVDVTTGRVINMINEGIIDPLLVPQEALKNAVSVAIQLMSTGYLIVPSKDD